MIKSARNLLFWLAFPFLAPQALYIRKTAPRSAPALGPTEGSVGHGTRIRLFAIGDSIIAGVGATTLSRALVGRTAAALATITGCRVDWQALGTSGYGSNDVLEHLICQLPGGELDFIIVSVGVNDITGLTRISTWRRNLARILTRLGSHSPAAVIAVAGMPPMHGFPLLPQPLRTAFGMRAKVFDQETVSVIRDFENTIHVPLNFEPDPEKFSPDGYHPSTESYEEFGRYMAESLIQLENTKRHLRSGE